MDNESHFPLFAKAFPKDMVQTHLLQQLGQLLMEKCNLTDCSTTFHNLPQKKHLSFYKRANAFVL
jgi:hypothetical protein